MKYLVGYNGSEEAKSALALARTYAETFGAKVFVATSMGGGHREKPENIGKATRDLASLERSFKEQGIACEFFQLARGMSPGEDLVAFAEQNDIDHIFIGVEKVSRTQKIIMGSTAQYIILKAPCPVVTVKNYPPNS